MWTNSQSFLILLLFLLLHLISPIPAADTQEYIVKLHDTTAVRLNSSAKNELNHHLTKILPSSSGSKFEPIFKKSPVELSGWFILRSNNSDNLNLARLQTEKKILHFQQNNHLRITNGPPNDSLYNEQWYHHKVKAYEAWTNYDPEANIILAIIDTGMDYHHPDLQGSFWVNVPEDLNNNGILDSVDINNFDDDGNGYIDDVIGWDFTDAPRFPDRGDYSLPDNDPMDEYSSGHGTQIAGIISAQSNNELGISGLVPGLRVMNLRAGTSQGYLEEDDVARAILYALNNGARIINMSFGDIVVSKFLEDVIRYAYSRGAIMVAAAGNSGSNETHYPSGFPETIAIGATTKDDQVAGFSNWGQTLDLVAPGVDIIATKLGGGYNSVQGTSFSTPMVAAAAGLLLSINPEFNNEQIRNAVKTSCDDIGVSAWDEVSGSGRLNMKNLCQVQYQSSLFIYQPASGSSSASDLESIIVTAIDADLYSISLHYGIGSNPKQWHDLILDYPYQVIEDTLSQIDLSTFTDTLIVLRLVSHARNGTVAEYRSLLYVDKTTPTISDLTVTHLYDGSNDAALLAFNSDDITHGEIYYRPKDSFSDFKIKSLDYETRNHKIIINSEDMSGAIEFYVEVTNLSGLKYLYDNDGKYFLLELNLNAIKHGGFFPLTWTLPPGYLLPYATDFDADGYDEVVLSKYDVNNAFGPIQIYEFNGSGFSNIIESDFRAIPRAAGDADADGKPELLVGFGRKSYLLEADQINEFPSKIIWQDTSDFWASQIADLDQDGNWEIIGRVAKDYKILECDGDNQFSEKFTFINESQGDNNLGPPKTVIADFDGDGSLEFVFGDYDGDINIFENMGNDHYEWRHSERLPFSDATDYMLSGSFFLGELPSLIVGCHSTEELQYEHESDARYWQFSSINAKENDRYELSQKINIYGYTDIRDFDSGLNSGSIKSGETEYLFLAPYPNLYILKAESDSLEPFCYYKGIQSNTILIHDFDKNGSSEFIFNDGQKITGFELSAQNQPLPPTRFSALPIDTVAVELEWSPVESFDKFIIYRGRSIDQLIKYDSTYSASSYVDDQVSLDSIYYYAIQTIDYNYENPFSYLSITMSAKPNFPPQVDSLVIVNDRQCTIYFNERMNRETFLVENFFIKSENCIASSVVPFQNDRAVLVSFSQVFVPRDHMQLELQNIRDSDNTLLDKTSRLLEFIYLSSDDKPYIQQWHLLDRHVLILTFNVPMDTASVLNLSNYTIEPSGRVEYVKLMDTIGKEYKITLSKDSFSGATGITSHLICHNLMSIQGVVFSEGNRISLSKTPLNLDELLVYPQPASTDSDWIMFANLTPKTEINIFDIRGRLVAKIKEADNNGGVRWNLTNSDGYKVAAGIYLYRAVSDKEMKLGKISIVR